MTHNNTAITIRAATAEDVAARGMGVGRQLLARLLHAFEDYPIHEISAIIDAENVASQRLFASFGFHCAATDPDYFEPGHPQQRWVKTWAEAIQTVA